MARTPPVPGAARDFARRYVELVEALQQQGVPEERARDEARMAATLVFLAPDHVEKGAPCPLCGRTE